MSDLQACSLLDKAKEHSRLKILLSICLGNILEHYDTALYAFLAPYLAPLLFPAKGPTAALISTYAIIPLSYVVRPLGALILGRMADNRGRLRALAVSLTGMGVVCFLLALMPLTPIFPCYAAWCFCLARMLQSFFSAVEVSGGAMYLLERIQTKRKKLLGSLFSASTIAGILLASVAVTALSFTADIKKVWPILYLGGSLVAFVALFLRSSFCEDLPSKESSLPFLQGLQGHAAPFFVIALLSGMSYAHYCICFLLPSALAGHAIALEAKVIEVMNTALLCLDFVLLPVFGALLEKRCSRKSLLALCLLSALSICPLLFLLAQDSILSFFAARVCFVLIGAAFEAPLFALFQSLVPKKQRFTVVTLASTVGSKAIGAPVMPVVLYTLEKTGSLFLCGVYVSGIAVVSFFALVMILGRKAVEEKMSI